MDYIQSIPATSSSAASQNQSNQIADEPTDISRKGEEKKCKILLVINSKNKKTVGHYKQIGSTSTTGSNIQNKKMQRFAMLAISLQSVMSAMFFLDEAKKKDRIHRKQHS